MDGMAHIETRALVRNDDIAVERKGLSSDGGPNTLKHDANVFRASLLLRLVERGSTNKRTDDCTLHSMTWVDTIAAGSISIYV